MKKPIIYYSHPMEHGGKLLNGCGRRAFDMKVKLKDHFEMWIPEENQAKDKSMQQKIDLDALVKADIIVVDLYHFGLVINGEAVLGMGTNQEVGFIKGCNCTRTKKVPIVQIVRSPNHPFLKEGTPEEYGVTKNCSSFEECISYLIKNYGSKI
jgi:hypothetical protein